MCICSRVIFALFVICLSLSGKVSFQFLFNWHSVYGTAPGWAAFHVWEIRSRFLQAGCTTSSVKAYSQLWCQLVEPPTEFYPFLTRPLITDGRDITAFTLALWCTSSVCYFTDYLAFDLCRVCMLMVEVCAGWAAWPGPWAWPTI